MMAAHGVAFAQAGWQNDLRSKYEQKILVLRNFYQDGRLEYDGTGSIKGTAHPGSWTTARVGINKVKFDANRLVIDGDRIANVFDTKTSKFTSVRTSESVRIQVDLNPQQPDSIEQALAQIFLQSSERLANFVPPYWKEFAEGQVETVAQEHGPPCYRIKGFAGMSASGTPWIPCEEHATVKSNVPPNTALANVYASGTAVRPEAANTPDPHYPELARKSGIDGQVLLWATVTTQGATTDISILRPLGFGLDDAAVEAVKTWTFKPAERDGQPVPVAITVEVNFRLK
jgi:TonB family protein